MAERGSTFNDSVHGNITLPPLCVKIVDTVEFQRLRYLKQLGLAYLVYPGASHNRFEHSLGVCHLAGRMVDQLNRNCTSAELITDEEKLCLEVAGLCHDMGHGPFSHAWEGFLKEREKKPKQSASQSTVTGEPKKWKHEDCSTQMFQHMIDSNSLLRDFADYGLKEKEIKFIKSLIRGEPLTQNGKPFLYEIISNELNGVDVDKWDYFLRDSKYLNLGQSFDHDRLLTTCRVMEVEGKHEESGNMHVAFRDKDVANVWDMFQVRAQLHSKAYQHPVVKILEQMWSDALIAADDEGYTVSNSEGTSVSLSEAQLHPEVWKYVTDHIFYDILNNSEKKFENARKILHRILKRDLYHEFVRVEVQDTSLVKGNESGVIDEILSKNNFSPNEYCLTYLKFDMGKMREGAAAFDNFFFYAKDATKAKPIDISRGAVFPGQATQLKRQTIMVLEKGSKRRGTPEEARKIADSAEEIRKRIQKGIQGATRQQEILLIGTPPTKSVGKDEDTCAKTITDRTDTR